MRQTILLFATLIGITTLSGCGRGTLAQGPFIGCRTHTDCDDGDKCTVDRCVVEGTSTSCDHSPKLECLPSSDGGAPEGPAKPVEQCNGLDDDGNGEVDDLKTPYDINEVLGGFNCTGPLKTGDPVPGGYFTYPGAPAIYYLSPSGTKRFTFPTFWVWMSWNGPGACMCDKVVLTTLDRTNRIADYGGITSRPGTRLITRRTADPVYAVEHGGILRWIRDQKVVEKLYGYEWAQLMDYNGSEIVEYRMGADINYEFQHNPKAERDAAQTVADELVNRGLLP